MKLHIDKFWTVDDPVVCFEANLATLQEAVAASVAPEAFPDTCLQAATISLAKDHLQEHWARLSRAN